MKKQYYRTSLDENKHNISRKHGTILRQAIGKMSNKANLSHTFLINNEPITYRTKASEEFNMYISQIGMQTSRNVPPTDKSFRDYMPRSILNSIFIEPVSTSDVISVANKLNPKTSKFKFIYCQSIQHTYTTIVTFSAI